jgi:hypothetical protein
MILLDEKEGKALTAAAMIAVFTRLRQIETWPAGIKVIDPLTKEIKLQIDVEESQKLDYIIHYDKEAKQFEGLIPEVVEDERVVVLSVWENVRLSLTEIHLSLFRMKSDSTSTLGTLRIVRVLNGTSFFVTTASEGWDLTLLLPRKWLFSMKSGIPVSATRLTTGFTGWVRRTL